MKLLTTLVLLTLVFTSSSWAQNPNLLSYVEGDYNMAHSENITYTQLEFSFALIHTIEYYMQKEHFDEASGDYKLITLPVACEVLYYDSPISASIDTMAETNGLTVMNQMRGLLSRADLLFQERDQFQRDRSICKKHRLQLMAGLKGSSSLISTTRALKVDLNTHRD